MEEEAVVEKKSKKRFSVVTYALGIVTGLAIATLAIAIVFVVNIRVEKNRLQKAIYDSVTQGSVVDSRFVRKSQLLKQMIDKYFYGEYDVEDLHEGMYLGMLEALDDKYTTYYTAEEFKKVEMDTEGIFYGIGSYISEDPDTGLCVLSKIMDDSPAMKAGLQDEDIIYKVNGEDVSGLENSDIVRLLRGDEGTEVNITVIRDGEEKEFKVIRGRVESLTVGYVMLDDNIGYIDIATFDTVTEDQFTDALVTLKEQGARGIIIDVRSNLGGGLEVVCGILRQILPKGVIVYTEDKNGKRTDYTCDGEKELDLPLVVLANQYSASASEILTGAVKDYKKGTVVGVKTFGKGIVQRLVPLNDGSALKLTISKYFTPSGVCIHGIGIEPDIEVELDKDALRNNGEDNQLNAAIDEIHRKWEEE